MFRFLIIGTILLAAAVYIRHQFNLVTTQITSNKQRIGTIRIGQANQPGRSRCLVCGGTGRTPDFTFATRNSHPTRPCPTCGGTGWVDNPAYSR